MLSFCWVGMTTVGMLLNIFCCSISAVPARRYNLNGMPRSRDARLVADDSLFKLKIERSIAGYLFAGLLWDRLVGARRTLWLNDVTTGLFVRMQAFI